MRNRDSVDYFRDYVCQLCHLTVDRTQLFQIFFGLRIVGDTVGKHLVRHDHQISRLFQQMADSRKNCGHSIFPGSALLINLICHQI